MQTFPNVSQQFYGAGGSGQWRQHTHVVTEADADPLTITLPGSLPNGGIVLATLNGLGLSSEDFSTAPSGGVSVMTVLINRKELVTGDTFVISAQLAG